MSACTASALVARHRGLQTPPRLGAADYLLCRHPSYPSHTTHPCAPPVYDRPCAGHVPPPPLPEAQPVREHLRRRALHALAGPRLHTCETRARHYKHVSRKEREGVRAEGGGSRWSCSSGAKRGRKAQRGRGERTAPHAHAASRGASASPRNHRTPSSAASRPAVNGPSATESCRDPPLPALSRVRFPAGGEGGRGHPSGHDRMARPRCRHFQEPTLLLPGVRDGGDGLTNPTHDSPLPELSQFEWEPERERERERERDAHLAWESLAEQVAQLAAAGAAKRAQTRAELRAGCRRTHHGRAHLAHALADAPHHLQRLPAAAASDPAGEGFYRERSLGDC
jgi:hypothetical protein